jgi:hypothetical protein
MAHFFLQKKTMTLNMDPRAEEGSFSDRRKRSELQPLQLLKVLKEELDSMAIEWPFSDDVKRLEVSPCCLMLCLQRVQISWKQMHDCFVSIPQVLTRGSVFIANFPMHESKTSHVPEPRLQMWRPLVWFKAHIMLYARELERVESA